MKRFFIVISVFLCMAMVFAGCSSSSKEGDNGKGNVVQDEPKDGTGDNSGQKTDDADISKTPTEGATDTGESNTTNNGTFKSITDIADYWNDLYTGNEAVINKMEIPMMELVTPAMTFVVGVQYELLNLTQADGRYDGELMLAGYPGFIEKKGAKLTFGYEDTLKENGFSPQMAKGDKLVENGNCDLDKGYYFADSYTERAGKKITHSTSEFQKESDGSMSSLTVQGETLNFKNEANVVTTYIFVRNGKNQYDFVIATSTVGTDYKELHLEADMTKEKAVALFKASGATITKSGGIKDGAVHID